MMKPQRKAYAHVPPSVDRKPSEVTDSYWIYAERKTGFYPSATENVGKWLVFVPLCQIDEVWQKIKVATQKGKLGNATKAATARPNPLAARPDSKVICVYTYDWTDEADVRRIRQELRKLGITSRIPYKTDKDTLAGKYASKGYKRIYKYLE